jgi:hypothetical protein
MLFSVPPWVEKDPHAYGGLISYKISVCLFFAGVIGFLAIALLLS